VPLTPSPSRACLAVAVAFLGLGCGAAVEKASEKAVEVAIESAGDGQSGAKVDIQSQSGTISIKTAEGEASFGAGTTLPADFPKDVPVYPGANVVSAIAANDNGRAGHHLVMETADGADKVVDFYKSNAPAGLTAKAEMNAGGSRTLMLTNADESRTVAVMANAQGGKTRFTLTVSNKLQ